MSTTLLAAAGTILDHLAMANEYLVTVVRTTDKEIVLGGVEIHSFLETIDAIHFSNRGTSTVTLFGHLYTIHTSSVSGKVTLTFTGKLATS